MCVQFMMVDAVPSVYDGVMMDPGGSGGDLAGAGLISILIPVDLFREQLLIGGLYRNDPDYLISSHNFFPQSLKP